MHFIATSSLNPQAPEFHPSSPTTAVRHRPPQSHFYLHHYPSHFSSLRFCLPHSLSNPPPHYYYYNINPSTSNGNVNIPPPPSSPPPTATAEEQATSRRSRGRRYVRQQWRRPPATVYRNRRRVFDGRRVCESSSSGREYKKRVMELEPDSACTTVMIRNIPARYTRDLLMQFLDEHCETMNTEASNSSENFISAYDFLYLPVDFQTNANKGFAFVNFTDPRAVWRFFQTSNDQLWDLFRSSKIRQIVRAKLQGREKLVKHFRGSTFRCKSDDYLPVCFDPARDGSAEQKVVVTTVGNRVW